MNKGHVRKRGERWAFVVELERDPATGKRRQRWVSGFRTKDDAERELRKRLLLIDEDQDAFPVETTVAAFAGSWLEHLETQGRLRPGTIRNYRQLVQTHVAPRIGGLAVRRVRPADIQGVLDTMTRAGKAPRTVAHARAAMGACFTYALRMGIVTVNPVRASEAPAKKVPELRTPNAAELRVIIDAAMGTRWEVPILLAATTGARRGEVLGLRWGNVDLARGRARIVEAVQRINKQTVFASPKTARAFRSVPLVPEVVERLRRHRAEQAQRLLALGIRADDETVVCDGGDGRPIDPSTFTHATTRIAADAGLPGVRLHDLRHAVATVLALSGNRPEITSMMLGHASVAFTLQTYTHPTDDELDSVTEHLGNALSG